MSMKPTPTRPSCGHCARSLPAGALVKVAVVARDGGGEGTLALCGRCSTHPESTWRLRWREVTG